MRLMLVGLTQSKSVHLNAMHSSIDPPERIPAFLYKLWNLVEDSQTDDLIHWRQDGQSFVMCNLAQFSRDVLPMHFKHSNMASFVRQLNMYGFRKVPSVEAGGLHLDHDEMEFAHPYFSRGCEEGLEHIKRKITMTRNMSNNYASYDDTRINVALAEIESLKLNHKTLMTNMATLRSENEIVWSKCTEIQNKFSKQQNVINKLMRFFIAVMKPATLNRSARNLPQLAAQNIYTGHSVPALTHGHSHSPLSDGPVILEVTDSVIENTINSPPKRSYVISSPASTNSLNASISELNDTGISTETVSSCNTTQSSVVDEGNALEFILDGANINTYLQSIANNHVPVLGNSNNSRNIIGSNSTNNSNNSNNSSKSRLDRLILRTVTDTSDVTVSPNSKTIRTAGVQSVGSSYLPPGGVLLPQTELFDADTQVGRPVTLLLPQLQRDAGNSSAVPLRQDNSSNVTDSSRATAHYSTGLSPIPVVASPKGTIMAGGGRQYSARVPQQEVSLLPLGPSSVINTSSVPQRSTADSASLIQPKLNAIRLIKKRNIASMSTPKRDHDVSAGLNNSFDVSDKSLLVRNVKSMNMSAAVNGSPDVFPKMRMLPVVSKPGKQYPIVASINTVPSNSVYNHDTTPITTLPYIKTSVITNAVPEVIKTERKIFTSKVRPNGNKLSTYKADPFNEYQPAGQRGSKTRVRVSSTTMTNTKPRGVVSSSTPFSNDRSLDSSNEYSPKNVNSIPKGISVKRMRRGATSHMSSEKVPTFRLVKKSRENLSGLTRAGSHSTGRPVVPSGAVTEVAAASSSSDSPPQSESLAVIPSVTPTTELVPAGSNALVNAGPVQQDGDEMQQLFETFQSMFNAGGMQCDPTVLSNLFNPEFPLSDFDFLVDEQENHDTTSGVTISSTQHNNQQVSVYDPTLIDVASMMESPPHYTGGDAFAMAPVDHSLLNTPIVERPGTSSDGTGKRKRTPQEEEAEPEYIMPVW